MVILVKRGKLRSKGRQVCMCFHDCVLYLLDYCHCRRSLIYFWLIYHRIQR